MPPPLDDEVAVLRERVAELERRLADDDMRRRAFEAAGDALVVHDDDGRFVDANVAACRLLGYPREELLRLGLSDLEPDFDLFGIKRHWARMRLGDAVTVDGRPRHRDGTPLQVEVRLSLLDDAPGRRRYLVLIRDLRERQATLRQLRESQARFRQLVENASDPFFLHDTDGRILDVNRRACDMLGCPRDMLLQLRVCDFRRDLGAEALRACWAGMPPGSLHTVETDFVRLDGEHVPVEVRVAAVEWEGQILFIAFARDIGDRRRVDEQRQRALRELARSNEELQQFASIASHDLKAPLRKVCSFAEILIDDYGAVLDDEGRKFLQIIADAAVRMQALVDDLLAWTRVGGRGEFADAVPLDAVLKDVVDDLSLVIAEAGARVESEPLPVVPADAVLMRQLFQNLLGNSLRYRHPERPPVLRVSARTVKWDPEVAGPACVLRFADNGLGFGPDDARRIFEPFRRLHRGPDEGGTGIGLAICQRIVDRHGGAISARGEPGDGATFEVRLPLRP
jgi:PAS domain S-box-containing protein